MSPNEIFSMQNKTTVIFGGTGKLGLNFSSVLSNAGGKIYLLDKNKIKDLPKNVFFIKCYVIKKKKYTKA